MKQRYLDIVWFLDGIPPVRWLKCRIGLHVPVNPLDGSPCWCGYCEKEVACDQ